SGRIPVLGRCRAARRSGSHRRVSGGGGPDRGNRMAGEIRSKDAIPDQAYRKMVLTLMDKQAGREVATAEVFGQCVLYAPTVEDKIRITRFQHEELKHFQLIARLMTELGVDMDAYVRDRQK